MNLAATYYNLLSKIEAPTLVVVRDEDSAREMLDLCKLTKPQIKSVWMNEREASPYSIIGSSTDNISTRFAAIADIHNADLIICTIASLASYYFSYNHYQSAILQLRLGQKISYQELIAKLQQMGYMRMMSAIAPGEFAVRGSLIDIALTNMSGVRIDFFGSAIESLREFSTSSQKTTGKLDELAIYPAREYNSDDASLNEFKERFINQFGVIYSQYLEQVMTGQLAPAVEYLSPLFRDRDYTLLDLINHRVKVVVDDFCESDMQSFYKDIDAAYQKRLKDAKIPTLAPQRIWLSAEQLLLIVKDAPTISSLALDGAKPSPNLALQAKAEKRSVFELVKEYTNDPSRRVFVACSSNQALKKLERLAKDHEIPCRQVNDLRDATSHGMLHLVLAALAHGLSVNQNMILSESDLFGHKLSKASKSLNKPSGEVFKEFNSLAEGDLVVHIEHGIGKFDGLETITVLGAPHDFVRLLYADGAKFYLPVENIDLISKHGALEAQLDKLGAVSWQKRKGKIKERIRLAAEQLLKTAAIRDVAPATPIEFDSELYEDFCNRFKYAETDDQLRAIEDIIGDLISGKSMDRLICGDVGFGKTEVAMRAVFLVLASIPRRQVAILVPTTLLSRQHFKNFQERFEGFGLKIAQLSKFTPRSEVSKIKKRLAEGDVDIVVGTHGLLAKDIAFHNLGLIVIDEEQHFGVRQKERLKELKKNCHILTLSATPIPRTLQMSLSGIKSLSIIASPPQDRLAVKTAVLQFDELTLREAILREVYRGGRVFLVTPRIAFIDNLCDFMKRHVPEVRFAAANGGLEASELDDIMNKFYDGEYDVLIATNIVESGLDIPMANTIIIDNAQLFGLAQLYQIRGRVGRGSIQAYAYLTYPPKSFLTPQAQKRLDILRSLDALGGGFSIASHDMDLRGYGNLVGEEQSGHIKEIGFELYQSMLQEAIENLQSGDYEEELEQSTTINIGVAVQLPETFIEDSSLRLSLFRRLAAANDEVALEDIAVEMIDRFGDLPEAANNLITLLKIKLKARSIGVSKIDYGTKGLVITFVKMKDEQLAKILQLAQKHPEIKIRPDNKILIERLWENHEKRLKGAAQIIESLAC